MTEKIAIQFKDHMISFFDELISQFPIDPKLIFIRIVISTRVEPQELVDYFVEEVIPEKEAIKNRDDRIFTEKDIFFKKLSECGCESEYFKKLWRSPTLGQENKDIIWQWMDLFLNVLEDYQDECRKEMKEKLAKAEEVKE